MGKLHKIRRAFDKLPDDQKWAIYKWPRGAGKYRNRPVYFGWLSSGSHKNFVKKLANEWYQRKTTVYERPKIIDIRDGIGKQMFQPHGLSYQGKRLFIQRMFAGVSS